jgi:hypothetical protein
MEFNQRYGAENKPFLYGSVSLVLLVPFMFLSTARKGLVSLREMS